MRSILRAILAFALLLGSGAAEWVPVSAQTAVHESCCCGIPAGAEDSCPCPKPEGNRTPAQSLCAKDQAAAVCQATRRTQAQRKAEPRPVPATWAQGMVASPVSATSIAARGRDPDLGRRLAILSTFRI